jgi:hypothetical protein
VWRVRRQEELEKDAARMVNCSGERELDDHGEEERKRNTSAAQRDMDEAMLLVAPAAACDCPREAAACWMLHGQRTRATESNPRQAARWRAASLLLLLLPDQIETLSFASRFLLIFHSNKKVFQCKGCSPICLLQVCFKYLTLILQQKRDQEMKSHVL